jgi:7-carboxy-7-deazaguanine synthase
MFGTNEITKPFQERTEQTKSLLVNEVFYTIQGEGPDAGRPAIFVRLAKCNLRCYFCDTEFERGEWIETDELIKRVYKIREETGCKLVVITGGEPLLQNIFWFVAGLNQHQMTCTIETAGTLWLDGLEGIFKSSRTHSPYGNAIICSPKTGTINPKLAKCIHALKYIIKAGETDERDGLPIKSTQKQGDTLRIARPNQCPNAKVYVQAMDMGNERLNEANLALASTIAMKHGYRLSVQLHKLAQLP